MSLKTQKGSANIPENAVLLSQQEALAYQKAIVRDWPSETEVFSLRYGHHTAAVTTTVSAGLIVSNLKRTLRIQKVSVFISSIIPSLVMPSVLSYYITETYLTRNSLLMKLNCPICQQIKYGLLQYSSAVIYPTVIGLLSLSMYVTLPHLKTYNLPDLKTQPREFWQEIFKILKSGSKTFQIVSTLNIALIIFLPYMQNHQLSNISKKLSEKHSLISEYEKNFQNDLDEVTW